MDPRDHVERYLAAAADLLGAQAITTSADSRQRHGEHTLPGPDKPPAAIAYPRSTAEVQALVRLANEHRVPLYPISTGNNIGLGSRAPVAPGQIIVDLGRHMNRILDVNEQLGYAVVEPGVTYQMLYDELVRRGDRFLVDTTSGPPFGGPLGNALDKGAGYGAYFDHFGMSCGMEIVLGSGEILRTGDGALEGTERPNWNVSKYSFGPIVDGLFAQSNYGIVTQLGLWLMPRPPAIRSFHFTFDDDDAFGTIVDLCRPLKLSNFVPTLFRVANDLYTIGAEIPSPDYERSGGRTSIPDAVRRDLQARHGLGAWTVSGAFYGPSFAAMDAQIERVRAHFTQGPGVRYIPHEQALENPPLKVAIDAFSGVPTSAELGLLKWRPGGGNLWFTPGTPMSGPVARETHALGRRIYAEFGMDYCAMAVCGARFQRGLHVITYNRQDPDERQRADACYRMLATEFSRLGISVGRAPHDYHAFHMGMMTPAFRAACEGVKRALDPNGVIAPGRYGIG